MALEIIAENSAARNAGEDLVAALAAFQAIDDTNPATATARKVMLKAAVNAGGQMNRFKEILYHPDMHDAKEALFTVRDKANAYKKLYPTYSFGEAALLEITNAVNYYQTQRKAHQDKVQAKKVEDDRKKQAKKESAAKKDAPKRGSSRKKTATTPAIVIDSDEDQGASCDPPSVAQTSDKMDLDDYPEHPSRKPNAAAQLHFKRLPASVVADSGAPSSIVKPGPTAPSKRPESVLDKTEPRLRDFPPRKRARGGSHYEMESEDDNTAGLPDFSDHEATMAQAQAMVNATTTAPGNSRYKRDIDGEINHCSLRVRHYLDRYGALKQELAEFEASLVAQMVGISEEGLPEPPPSSPDV